MPITLDNQLSLELPLKYPETYRVTFTPESPGPVTVEISASNYPPFTIKMEGISTPNVEPKETCSCQCGKAAGQQQGASERISTEDVDPNDMIIPNETVQVTSVGGSKIYRGKNPAGTEPFHTGVKRAGSPQQAIASSSKRTQASASMAC
ncbi:hypothetical protein HYDPIDRAFT_44720 [Hydnomerulius pinastri MD-312]|uniref:Uncharacterized protein n=1 Tax=Hydnomerulius pinastri MD-312 TaxID=994086 RepID=A0A0C9VX55_9AGAM|nr:hypothetical protein HYDPIDRAFT_44720 [Hydnomerulius pinastri MD-312]